jgi:hypothetical protein
MDRVLRIANEPRPLSTLRQAAALLDGRHYEVTEDRIREVLDNESWAGPLHRVLQVHMARWDHAENSEWTDGTSANTPERRTRVYDLLQLDVALRQSLDEKIPFFPAGDQTLIIAERFERWYTEERKAGSTFYWDAFARYLETVNGWDQDSIMDLDRSTTAVVERISDPSRPEAYQAKGLVVGHVQSGKTANITGVIAKTADAGYRLAIVLSGTMNLLRAQTQRRIDKELVGKELIRPQGDEVSDEEELDYLTDADWDKFISHGGRPSQKGAFDWIRLTGAEEDYQRLKAGIETLNFECREPARPFYHPDNLLGAKAKLMVIKKNAAVLRRVARDLRQVTSRLNEVPAVVLDDESDLASVNTARPPTQQEERKRTAINRAIVELLQQLPRAQYVGYTATPFANVFISPADAQDLFPKDFMVSLKRPRGYMGAIDFHDLAGVPPEADVDPFRSNQRAFVRDVRGADEADSNLPRAIDSYVLSGAIKLYREMKLPTDALRRNPFRHHTMLVHSSARIAVQHEMADKVLGTVRKAGYEGGTGMRRIRQLFETDFEPVSASREPDLPMPHGFDELRPFIGRMLALLNEGVGPVRIVNGEPGNDDPDFDQARVWKVLVGGAKLSRGYTFEGLTVSYFRRAATAADTLMQMGRWFGFREFYGDLVRLFIGRDEGGVGLDLYAAFEGICRDEETFRDELKRYATPIDGSDPITPMQVPPLVASHLEWVRPTARNKMFNAVMKFKNLGGKWREPTLAPTADEREKRRANQRLFRELVQSLTLERRDLRLGGEGVGAWIGLASLNQIEKVLRGYEWANGYKSVQHDLEFLAGTDANDPEIDGWTFMAPLLARPREDELWPVGEYNFTVKFRQRVDLRVGVYTEPFHKEVANAFIGADPTPGANEAVEHYRNPRRGVFLFYPVTHVRATRNISDTPTMGFAMLFPGNHIARAIVFSVRDPSQPDSPIVDELPG